MSRKQSVPLIQTDLERFLAQSSDFGLEMAVLGVLRSLGLEAEHAATYTDPITNRIRAFDIRARWSGPDRTIRLAVECKSLAPSAPLVVHATPRLPTEAYHTIVTRRSYTHFSHVGQSTHQRLNIYQAGDPVGRQTDQPIQDDRGEFKSSDAATYEKWLQAVNGCFGLIREALEQPPTARDATAVVPILVVPAGTLWQIEYDENGRVSVPVRPVDETTLILRHVWTVPSKGTFLQYDISHLEIVCLPRLAQRVRNLTGSGGLLADIEALFPQ